MKLRYLLALPIIATALTGCDEIEYSDAKPVENPQLPGITQNDFSVTLSEYLQNGLNLESLSQVAGNAESYQVPLYTINTNTDQLPEGAEVSGTIQLAKYDDPTFQNPFNVTTTSENGVVSATLADLAYTRSTMYGKDPRPYEVLYRISVFVNVDGGQFKIGLKDFYYNDGDKFMEEGVDPGYTVEEAYYLYGPKGTSINDAIPFQHSGYNIYDDTIFNVTAIFENGDSWLVVPESAYQAALKTGTLDTSLCYGPAEVGADKGALVLGNPAGSVTQGSKCQIEINLAELTYTLTEMPLLESGDPTGVYVRGDMNGWGAPATYEFIATDDQNVYIMPYVEIVENLGFKIADENWSAVNLGSTGAPLVAGEPYQLATPGDNLSLSAPFVGSLILTQQEDGSYTLLLQPFEADTAGVGSGIYVRGGMNNWGNDGLEVAFEFMTSAYKNVWYLNSQNISAGTEFKVADAGWSEVNLGANVSAGGFDETSGTGILGLVSGGGNITLAQNFTGNLRLVKVNDHYYLFFILD